MRKNIGFLLMLALLASSTVQVSVWAEMPEQPDMLADHAHLAADVMDEAHCEADQHDVDLSCWSHCTFAPAAPMKMDLVIHLFPGEEDFVPVPVGNAKLAITPHWRPPILFS